MAQLPKIKAQQKEKHWAEKLARSRYFFGALLFHLVLFLMVATWVIFPAVHPPTEDFVKTYLPPASHPPPPPSQPEAEVPTKTVSTPMTTITSPSPTVTFSVPIPDLTPATTPVEMNQKMMKKVEIKTNTLSPDRLGKITETLAKWGRDRKSVLESNSDPRNITAKFPVYLASYANGDWGCNVDIDNKDGKIISGSLPNLVAKINEWSKGNIKGEVIPTPLNIGSPELMDKRPPFVFFTGHKDFVLTDQEIQNLRDYLQVGGAVWGDNALAGWGSRFDVAFRREMKRVVPDLDKNFEPVAMTDDVFTKSWFQITKIPEGMNYYAEPLEHLDIDGKLAIFYTPNDYSDMFTMRIMPGDMKVHNMFRDKGWSSNKPGSALISSGFFLNNSGLFTRNYELPSCLACDKLGMNVLGYLLVRFDKDLLLSP